MGAKQLTRNRHFGCFRNKRAHLSAAVGGLNRCEHELSEIWVEIPVNAVAGLAPKLVCTLSLTRSTNTVRKPGESSFPIPRTASVMTCFAFSSKWTRDRVNLGTEISQKLVGLTRSAWVSKSSKRFVIFVQLLPFPWHCGASMEVVVAQRTGRKCVWSRILQVARRSTPERSRAQGLV